MGGLWLPVERGGSGNAKWFYASYALKEDSRQLPCGWKRRIKATPEFFFISVKATFCWKSDFTFLGQNYLIVPSTMRAGRVEILEGMKVRWFEQVNIMSQWGREAEMDSRWRPAKDNRLALPGHLWHFKIPLVFLKTCLETIFMERQLIKWMNKGCICLEYSGHYVQAKIFVWSELACIRKVSLGS